MNELRNVLKDYVDANTPAGPPPPLKVPSSSRRPWFVAAAAAAVIAVSASTWFVVRDADPEPVPELTVRGADSAVLDHLPNTSATDWVTYADHVVVVTATDEEEVAPAASELESGEGLIGREVALRVDDVVWSRPSPDRPAPETISWQAWGWTFEGDPDNRGRIALEGTPRIEVGHTYLLAIEWEEARCSPGDERQPASWRGLGSTSSAPFDDGVVGQGEVAGTERTLAETEAQLDSSDPNFSFVDEMTGNGVAEVRAALEQTEPTKRKEFTPPAPCDD